MLKEKIALHLAGPTPIPPQVAAAMTMPMINHRSDTFSVLCKEVASKLEALFRTQEQVYVLASSGSSGWETAMVNFVPAGVKVLNVIIGDFGERWSKANAELGYEVENLRYASGTAAKAADVAAILEKNQGSIKAVCFQHNETSTGVSNPVKEIAVEATKYGALSLVDGVSSVGALPLHMDEWGIDVAFTGSQKTLMCPPGLMLIAASKRAWAQADEAHTPKFYFNLQEYRKNYDKGQTPQTPAISLYYGLQAALHMLENEGWDKVQERHHLMGEMCRAGIKATGLKLLCQEEEFASDTLTAVMVPDEVKAATFLKTAKDTFGVIYAAGQGKELKERIFRIGHMGYMTPNDVLVALSAVENSLALLGYSIQPGKAVAAAQEVWLRDLRQR